MEQAKQHNKLVEIESESSKKNVESLKLQVVFLFWLVSLSDQSDGKFYCRMGFLMYGSLVADVSRTQSPRPLQGQFFGNNLHTHP